jgi:hypothetical protein
MTERSGDDGPIELHLPDGGHVIMTIDDATIRCSADCDELIGVLVRADGSEHDVERAVIAEAHALGLRCTSSTSQHPTVLVIAR